MSCGSLFSGIGLLDYGLHLAGWEHRWFCEADEWRRGILNLRWPGVPALDDVRRAGRGTLEPVVLVAGGFPCKGGSTAGKRNGLDHPETALWHEMARVIRELRPRYVLIENVANLLAIHDGAVWGTVLGDLAACGYDAEWDVLPAAAFGAPHLRERVFCVATDADGASGERVGGVRGESHGRADIGGGGQDAADTDGGGLSQHGPALRRRQSQAERRIAVPTHPPADAEIERRAASAGIAQRGGVRAINRGVGTGAGRRPERDSRGVAVAWGAYEPAIRRWEQVHGPAPEPLVRRVDDRDAARVERSRLSALGDGVQVQAGYFMGRLIMERELARLRDAV